MRVEREGTQLLKDKNNSYFSLRSKPVKFVSPAKRSLSPTGHGNPHHLLAASKFTLEISENHKSV